VKVSSRLRRYFILKNGMERETKVNKKNEKLGILYNPLLFFALNFI